MHDLIADGNSIVLVDHDTQILRDADYMVELGPGAGSNGGKIIAQGSITSIEHNPDSKIGPFLSGKEELRLRPMISAGDIFDNGCIHIKTSPVHTVKPLDIKIPKGRLTVVTGVSGSGKTTMVLESIVPGLQSQLDTAPLSCSLSRCSRNKTCKTYRLYTDRS